MAAPNLPKCLEPNSIIPTDDIRFLFKQGNNSVKEVKAQKVILAIGSDVFEREFYGSINEKKDEVTIVDASQEVFQVMIDFIYNKQPNWKDLSISFLCSLYYLAEKYNIGSLKTEIIACISEQKIKITEEKVLEVAHLAEKNSPHEPLSEALYDVATAVLKAEFRDKVEKASEFFKEAEFSQANAVVLFKMMSRLNSVKTLPPSCCNNCHQTPCLTGKGVTRKNFVPGAKIEGFRGMGFRDVDELISQVESSQFNARFKDGTMKLCTLDPNIYIYKCS
eukprot:GFUD01072476.1.p1 GENE.GFUD01072476.1~~GFUD01072476.1.p1  ORF type:complete len:278 (-),score=80.84 GFUD01072476.1:11-844(-)